MKNTILIVFCSLLCISSQGQDDYTIAQKILLDKPYSAGKLLVYPVYEPGNPNSKQFRYLPNDVHFAKNNDGTFKFSFTKYAKNNVNDENTSGTGIRDGGGYVHCVIELGVTQQDLDDAQTELQNVVRGAKIIGPAVFQQGKFFLVNKATVDEAGNDTPPKVLGVGSAPTVDGSQVAVAFGMTPENALIFEQTLQSPKPDISFNFDMDIAGYFSPKNLKITFNSKKIKKSTNFQAGARAVWFNLEFQKFVDSLIRNGSISIEGAWQDDDKATNELIQQISSMFLKIYSDPISNKEDNDFAMQSMNNQWNNNNKYSANPNAVGQNKGKGNSTNDSTNAKKGFFDRFGDKLGNFNVTVAYINKSINSIDDFVFTLNNYQIGTQPYVFGTGLDRFGSDLTKYVKQVDISKPNFYSQRELLAKLEGVQNLEQFDKTLNSVFLKVKKKHQNGKVTEDDIYIGRDEIKKENNIFKLYYPFEENDDVSNWYKYDYQVVWNYKDGSVIEDPWKSSSDEIVRLVPPYVVRQIQLIGDKDKLNTDHIRLSNVKVKYPVSGSSKLKSQSVLTSKAGDPYLIEVLARPDGAIDYKYEINRVFDNGTSPTTTAWTSGTGEYLFIDN